MDKASPESGDKHLRNSLPAEMVPFCFKLGQSGNPNGRPKGARDGLRAALNRALRRNPNGGLAAVLAERGIEINDKTLAEGIVEVLSQCAAKGDLAAIKIAFDQTEEPFRQSHEITGEDGAPIQIEHGLNADKLDEIKRGLLGLEPEVDK